MFFRKQFITHREVQLKLAGVFLFWFFVFIAVFGFIYVFNFSSTSDRTKGMVIHDQLLTNMLLVDQTKELALYYGLAALGYVVLVFFYLLVYSHRLTGPIYKMNMILDKAIHNREWPDHLSFRKSDAFSDTSDKFNQLMVILKESSKNRSAS